MARALARIGLWVSVLNVNFLKINIAKKAIKKINDKQFRLVLTSKAKRAILCMKRSNFMKLIRVGNVKISKYRKSVFS